MPVACRIAQREQLGPLPDIDAIWADFHPGGDAKSVREDHRFVSPTVAVRITQSDDLIITLHSWLDLRISVGAGHIHTAIRVPT